VTKRVLAATVVCCLLAALPVRAQDQFFDSQGVRIRYVVHGQGEPVVLMHGNGGSLEGWIDAGVLPNLAKDYKVIAFDARGHGKSGKPHETAAYGRQMGLDAIRLLDHLGVRQAHIVGYSMGASIAATLLTTHHDRFLTATLGGAAGRFRWTGEDVARAEVEAAEKEKECVSRSQMNRLRPIGQPAISEAEFQRLSAACLGNANVDRFAMAAVSRGMKDQMITSAQVAAVKVPTLGVVGSLDRYLADFQALEKLRPAMRLVVIDGASHGGERGAMRRPEFVAAVRELLAAKRSTSVR
jgi:pimeloyl-ACP methyl ester carboxylesterase